MGIIQSVVIRWNNILNYIISYFKGEDTKEIETECQEEDIYELAKSFEDRKASIEEDMIVVNKRSMLSKLYSMEQMVKNFENDFPEQYAKFYDRIKQLKEEYQRSLNEYIDCYNNGDITFEIDPEEDSRKIAEVCTLENEVKNFMEREFKYNIMSKRILKLCFKLNILYNTSLLYFRDSDRQNVVLQASRARENLLGIVEDLKQTEFVKSDKIKKEYLLDCISYADYLILKCNLRNSQSGTDEQLNNLVIVRHISGIDHLNVVREFVLEEIVNLQKLLELLKEENYYFSILDRVKKIQNEVYIDMYALKNNAVWENIFNIEDNILNSIRLIGKDSIAKIALLERFDIEFDEKEIFFSVKSQTCLALADIFFKTKDPNVAVVLKLMYELDDNVTYKEVYLILLLFGLVDIVKSRKQSAGSFVSNIVKKDEKYSYSVHDVENKKSYVKNMSSEKKTYVKILSADEYDLGILSKALEDSNFDYIVSGNSIYLNSFYFHEMENVKKSLDDKKAYNEF